MNRTDPASAPGSDPAVSVIVATIGRASLSEAVQSALDQELPPLEVIIVFDSETVPAEFTAPAGARVLCTGSSAGVNAARELGVRAAEGDAIALLDDDDYWYPGKLAAQTALMRQVRAAGMRAVIGCGLDFVVDGQVAYSGPTRFIVPGQRLADYLFKRRQIRDGGASLHTSSLLIDRELLIEVPLDVSINIHEDWDWMLRTERRPNVQFAAVAESLFAYRLPGAGARISRSDLWPQSVAWIESQSEHLTSREYGDFLVSVSVPLAIDAGQRAPALKLILRALSRARPGLPALAMAGGLMLLPRQGSRALWPALSGLTRLRQRAVRLCRALSERR